MEGAAFEEQNQKANGENNNSAKPSKFGVVTYKSPHSGVTFKCTINDDQTLTRFDNQKKYDAVSAFVQDVDREGTMTRDHDIFSLALGSGHRGNPRLSELPQMNSGSASEEEVPRAQGADSPLIRQE